MEFGLVVLLVGSLIICIIFGAGFLLKPKIESKIQQVIDETLAKKKIELQSIECPESPDTGPFEDAINSSIINTMNEMMGLYTNYSAYRIIHGIDVKTGKKITAWLKIKFGNLLLQEVVYIEFRRLP